MSEIEEFIVASALDYISGESVIGDFQSAFAGAYFYVRQRASAEKDANRLVTKLIAPLAEFAGGHRSEESLRSELAIAIRPFQSTLQLAHRYEPYALNEPLDQEFSFGIDPIPSVLSSLSGTISYLYLEFREQSSAAV